MDFRKELKLLQSSFPPLSSEFDSKKWIELFEKYTKQDLKGFCSVSDLMPYVVSLFRVSNHRLRVLVMEILFLNCNEKECKKYERYFEFLFMVSLQEDNKNVIFSLLRNLKQVSSFILKMKESFSGNSVMPILAFFSYAEDERDEISKQAFSLVEGLQVNENQVNNMLSFIYNKFEMSHRLNIPEAEKIIYLKSLRRICRDPRLRDFLFKNFGKFMKNIVNVSIQKTHQSPIKYSLLRLFRVIPFSVWILSISNFVESIERAKRKEKDPKRILTMFWGEKKVDMMWKYLNLGICGDKNDTLPPSSHNIETYTKIIPLILKTFGIKTNPFLKEKQYIEEKKSEKDDEEIQRHNEAWCRYVSSLDSIVNILSSFDIPNSVLNSKKSRISLFWFFLSFCDYKNSPSFDNHSFTSTSSTLSLNEIRNCTHFKSTSKTSRLLVSNLLDKMSKFGISNSTTFNDILNEFRPLFFQNKNEDGEEETTDEIKLNDDDDLGWKKFSWTIPMFRYFLLKIPYDEFFEHKNLRNVLGFVFRLLSDWEKKNKIIGSELLQYVLDKKTTKTMIREYRDPIMHKLVKNMNFRDDPNALESTMKCLFKVLHIMIPKNENIFLGENMTYMKDIKDVFFGIINAMKFTSTAHEKSTTRIRIILLDHLARMIREFLGVHVVIYFPLLLDAWFEESYVQVFVVSSSSEEDEVNKEGKDLFLKTMEIIEVYCEEAWPRIDEERAELIVGMLEKGNYFGDRDCEEKVKGVLGLLRKIVDGSERRVFDGEIVSKFPKVSKLM